MSRSARDRTDAVANQGDTILRAFGFPTAFLRDRFDFVNDKNEWRRLFAELLGTFFLVLVAEGGGMVNARFGGNAIGQAALVTAPGLMEQRVPTLPTPTTLRAISTKRNCSSSMQLLARLRNVSTRVRQRVCEFYE